MNLIGLTVDKFKKILREFLNLIDLKKAKVLCGYELTEIIMVNKD